MSASRRTVLKALVAGGLGVTGLGTYGYAFERHRLGLIRASLPVSGLPPALAGFTIGLITDLHHSPTVSRRDVQQAILTINRAQPDLIVLGGDYVTWGDREYIGPVADMLAALRAPHGVFAVLGNHDDDREMPSALHRQRIEVLRDARTRIVVRNEPLELAGIRFWTRRVSDIVRVIAGATAPLILLAHDPRRLTEAAALDVPLVLSGHTHGGQVVLPGIGAIAARKFPVIAGVGQRENTTIFVSRGVGTVYVPYRLNCPPDVAILTLTPRDLDSAGGGEREPNGD